MEYYGIFQRILYFPSLKFQNNPKFFPHFYKITVTLKKGQVNPKKGLGGGKWHNVVIFQGKRQLKSPDLEHSI
jgi:hypothetical protein